jgi:hypothetical protein
MQTESRMRQPRGLVVVMAAVGAVAVSGLTVVEPPLAARQRQASSSPGASHKAANRPGFRGPASNPVSDNTNLPVRWSKDENVEWAADVPGVGWSSPVVWDRRVFVTSAVGDKPMKPPAL